MQSKPSALTPCEINDIYNMTGMPISAIVLAIGIGTAVILDTRSAQTPIIPPVSSEAGSIVLWADVPSSAFAMCGAIMPTNPIGPQNAVTAPVMMLQLSNADMRIPDGLPPESSVNSSPNSIRSRPLWLHSEMVSPAISVPAMIAVSVHVVLEKLPADQL